MPPTLDTVVITEKRQSLRLMEFEYRRRLGIGEFMTQSQIDQRATIELKDLLQTFKTVNVSPSYAKGMPEYYALSKRGGGALQGECAMAVLVDGMRMPQPFDLNLMPPPKELAGIEVYGGSATVPAQYGGMNSGCGMVLVWTREGRR